MLSFIKMHGLGNDFVIFDFRKKENLLTKEQIKKISDRNKGVGCDQLITLTKSKKADVFMNIFNADGTTVSACGNATRCVASIIMNENKKASASIETNASVLFAQKDDEDKITVNMGSPIFDWQDIPLAKQVDVCDIKLDNPDIKKALAVSMGNPHLVCISDDITKIDINKTGQQYESHKLFPKKTNVEFVQIIDKKNIRMKVYERGAGITKACGTGACATLVACNKANLCEDEARIILDGGILKIKWDKQENNIYMTGEVSTSFYGSLGKDLI